MGTSFDGSLPKEVCLFLDRSIVSCTMIAFVSLRRVFKLRVIFFAWPAALEKILTMTNKRK
jgi:hypothetical protein